MSLNQNNTDEIKKAEARVAEQKAQLSRSLREVSRSGKQMAHELGTQLKPALTVALVLGGAATLVGLVLALRSSSHRPRRPTLLLHGASSAGQPRPSVAASVLKAAALWALRGIARRAAQELVSRFASVPAQDSPSSHARA